MAPDKKDKITQHQENTQETPKTSKTRLWLAALAMSTIIFWTQAQANDLLAQCDLNHDNIIKWFKEKICVKKFKLSKSKQELSKSKQELSKSKQELSQKKLYLAQLDTSIKGLKKELQRVEEEIRKNKNEIRKNKEELERQRQRLIKKIKEMAWRRWTT